MKHVLAGVALAAFAATASAADPQLTDDQVAAAFAKVDVDNDGTVSMAEARRFGISAKAFRQANPDKDGTLDKKEFAAAIVAQFKSANPDADGTVDWKEAKKAGVKSKKTFDAADPDKDKTLDIGEYLAALVAQWK